MGLIPGLSIDVQILTDALLALKVGEVITYGALSKLVGCDVQFECRHKLTSAVDRCLQRNVVIGTDYNVGVKRLNDLETIATMHHHTRKMRKAFRKQAKRITTVDYDNLPKKQQIEHNAALAMLGTYLYMSASKQQRAIESEIERVGKRINVAGTLELFAKKKE